MSLRSLFNYSSSEGGGGGGGGGGEKEEEATLSRAYLSVQLLYSVHKTEQSQVRTAAVKMRWMHATVAPDTFDRNFTAEKKGTEHKMTASKAEDENSVEIRTQFNWIQLQKSTYSSSSFSVSLSQ